MKKLITIIVTLFLSVQVIFAQQAIAKLKYEEAEEAYTAKNYQLTISKLQEVESLLKSTNPRTMYLKIMAQYEIVKKNPLNSYSMLLDTKNQSKLYLAKYENIADNEERFRAIYNIYEEFNKYPISEIEYTEKVNLSKKLAHDYLYSKDSLDYVKAIKYLIELTQNEDFNAYFELGSIYLNGLGVNKDYNKALQYFNKAADLGDVTCKAAMGNMYFKGFGVSQNYNMATKLFKEAVDGGGAGGQNGLGVCYELGVGGLELDYAKAKQLFELAANQGNSNAQTNLAFLYITEQGVKQDYALALKYLHQAELQANPYAQYGLGNMYLNGDGVKKDYKQAVSYYQLSANQNNSLGQCNLGLMYYNGDGVKKDYKQAVDLWKLSADQLDRKGQYELGYHYINGFDGIIKDQRLALLYLKKSAEQNYYKAYGELYTIYYYGIGVPKNKAEANLCWERCSFPGDIHRKNVKRQEYPPVL